MTDSGDTPLKPLLVNRTYYTFAQPPNEMILECGSRLGPITLAYETLGELNANRTNAILILHAFSGDSHVAGYLHENDERPGWWDNMVGPGKPVDTNRYFVICSNILGGLRWFNRTLIRQSRDRQALCPQLSHGYHQGHGPGAKTPHRSPGHRKTDVFDRRLRGRYAGPALVY
jgi:hypothetical protein